MARKRKACPIVTQEQVDATRAAYEAQPVRIECVVCGGKTDPMPRSNLDNIRYLGPCVVCVLLDKEPIVRIRTEQ